MLITLYATPPRWAEIPVVIVIAMIPYVPSVSQDSLQGWQKFPCRNSYGHDPICPIRLMGLNRFIPFYDTLLTCA